MYLASKQENIL